MAATSRLIKWGTRLGLTMLVLGALVLGALWVLSLPYQALARGWWKEAIHIAEQHIRFEVAHPGWSFPARVRTQETPLTLPFPKLLLEAKARGYTERCPEPGPGEYCEKQKKVIPRSGNTLEPIELGWLFGKDSEMRIHLPLQEAPRLLIDAILAAEDRAFFQHRGVNFSAVVRAAWSNAREQAVIQGGSTLTMQLVRSMVQRREKTFERKAREIIMALAVDRHLGKERVLQMYLDAPYLGQRGGISICGFEAASWHYYGHSARELSLDEAATLAAILPAPAKFAPDKAPALAHERRDRVLHAMAEAFGYSVDEALKAPIKTTEPLPYPERYPAFFSATRAWLESHLPLDVVYGAGLQVVVGMDVFRQEVANDLFTKKVPYLENIVGRRADTPLQAAAVMLDVETGLIRVIYGGSDATPISFNRATQARRQAGSSFKPLVYSMAFNEPPTEDGRRHFTAAFTVPNSPRVFKTPQGDWSPRNIAGEYTVTSPLAQALTWSQNIATAGLLEEAGGPEKLIRFAQRVGFDTSHFPAEYGLALGQGEVTPLEMAQWVATVSNGGRLISGTPVLSATDVGGNERISPPRAGPQVLSPEAALLTRELMRLVIDMGTGGAARGGGGEAGYSGQALGKTGTTDKEKDLWFTGATPTLGAVVWLGYDTPTPIKASASDFAAPLWGWWMNRSTRYDGELPQFKKEVPFIRRDICNITGKVPNETCRVIPAPFIPGTNPKELCPTEHPPPEPEESPTPEPLLGEEPAPGGTTEKSLSPAPATDTAAPDEKKKRRGHESIWQRMSRQQAEKEAQKSGQESAPTSSAPAGQPTKTESRPPRH